jgi:hypothetical protein
MAGLASPRPSAVRPVATSTTVATTTAPPAAIYPSPLPIRPGGDVAPTMPEPTATAPAVAPSYHPPAIKGRMPLVRPRPLGSATAGGVGGETPPLDELPCPSAKPAKGS